MKNLYVKSSIQKRSMTTYLVIALLSFLSTIAMAQEAQWARTIGSSDADQITSIAYDNDGCVYIVGTFEGTVNFNPYLILNGDYRTSNGGKDIFIQKYDPNNIYPVSWTRTFGGPGDDFVADMDIDLNKVSEGTHMLTIAGDYENTVDFNPAAGEEENKTAINRDVFVTYYHSTGAYQRTKVLEGTGYASAKAVKFTTESSIALTGIFTGHLDLMPENESLGDATAHGDSDIFLVNMGTTAGNYTFMAHFGGPGLDEVYCLDTDEDNNIYIGGAFSETADFDATIGEINITSVGKTDMFLASYSTSTGLNWVRSFGNEEDNALTAMTIANNSIWSAMSFYGEIGFQTGWIGGFPVFNNYTSEGKDVLLMRHQTDGTPVTQSYRKVGGNNTDQINDMKTDSKGNIVITGFFSSSDLDLNPDDEYEDIFSTAGGNDIFMALLTDNYEYIWGGTVGGTTSADVPASLALTEGGTIYNAGKFNGDVNFNPWAGDAINRSSTGFSNGYFWAVESYNSATDILTFEMTEQTAPAAIDNGTHQVDVEVESETDISSLSPTITISENAVINPPSGEAQDFTNPVTYQVTAENGVDIQDWTVQVSVATGEQQAAAHSFQIYPNPASNYLFIELPQGRINEVKIFSLSGKQLLDEKYAQQKVKVNVESLPDGIYLIKINTSDQKSINKKLIIKQ
ncbi:MAG: T9SS type A sorting domain-containing protein [Bacteroidota bacterium]